MWDVDQTLLRAGRVVSEAYAVAFTAATGRAYASSPGGLAGRTDRHIAAEAFALNGIDDAEPYLERFFALFAAEVHSRRELLVETGYLLPGAAEVVAALARRPEVVQTLGTGNIRPLAETKLAAFGLDSFIDVTVGGYGTDDVVRPTLVTRSLERARASYGDFDRVLVIGDTVHDIEAALVNGVTAVGVASGPFDAETLRAAGAHHVFDSLAGVDDVVDLVTGPSTAP
jgi:phosphoglycolate phosphatase-like HAD superfamily hydrolase